MKYIESEKVELKRELTDDLKKEIIAFLNTLGGTIYIGVNDEGNINNEFITMNRDEISQKVSNWIQDVFYPLPSSLIQQSYNEDGVFVLDIHEGIKKPYYLKEKGPRPNGVFKRVGTTIRSCSEEEILMMIMSSNLYSYENEESEEQDLTFKKMTRIFNDKGLELTDRNQISLGIINRNNRYTNLGYLLSDQSEITIKVAEYDANLNFRLKKEFRGCLAQTLFDVKEQAERMNDISAIIDPKTFTRIETKSYPDVSIREVIVNAFCHADYFIRSNIKIEFFPDRLKVTNPGGIFNATLDDILNGTQTYRNPRLVHIFDKLGIIENYGTGILRVNDAYKKYNVMPKFEATNNFFYVTLPNLNYYQNYSVNDQINESMDLQINYKTKKQINDQINDQINNRISDMGLNILKLINDNPGINVPEIFKILNRINNEITIDRIRNSIKRELKNIIEFKGSKKTGGYYMSRLSSK